MQIYNNPAILSQFLTSSSKQTDTVETFAANSNGLNSLSSLLLTPLFEFQQDTLKKQQNEIDYYKKAYEKLLVQHNEMGMKLEKCQKSLILEVIHGLFKCLLFYWSLFEYISVLIRFLKTLFSVKSP